jgi:hypothetical protein
LNFEGGLRGSYKNFPLRLKAMDGLKYKTIEIKDIDELTEIINGELENDEQHKKKLTEICDNIGLYDTIILMDFRTKQLFELFQTYKFAPHLIDVSIFQDVVIILNQFENVRMF